mmetsp:Transcript_26808/g.104106  ORF Transcript_26808/g.104106 Transcript_26808/m.104106 type:complete len:206 (-) Transcript_26808:940-1557(-)
MFFYLVLVERSNSRKDLALQEFERRTSSSGDVAHLLGQTGLLYSCNGVTSSDDSGDPISGELGEGVSDIESALGESLELEHSHGTIPDHSLALRELVLDHLRGLGAVVKSHPAVRDVVDRHNLCVGVSGEGIGNDYISRQNELYSLLSSLRLQLLGKVELVFLNKRGSNVQAPGLEESKHHSSANDELVNLAEEGLDDSDLRGHF